MPESEISQLKDALREARGIVLDLMPTEIQRILSIEIANRTDIYSWRNTVIERLLEVAVARPAKEMGEFSSSTDRAYCPLCQGSSQDVYGLRQGFAMPDGLRRHFEGSHQSRQCPVLAVAMAVRRERIQEQRDSS